MPIYFSWFITALLSVSAVRTITTYRKVGAFLYCVKMRTRVQNTLQAIALNHALRQGRGLWTATGQKALQALSLPSYTRQRRDELLRLYVQLQQRIQELDGQVEKQVQQRPQALRLLTHPGVGHATAFAT